jgi:DNA replication and repair protein RecF
MIISRLQLSHFRNHTNTDVRWARRMNIVTGPNGAGKTNLIDAIHYLCMSRSFVATTDQYVVTSGEKEFSIDGHFEGTIRKNFKVTCSYARGSGKKILVNDSPLDKLSDLIGMVPVVVLSPDDKRLTSDGPAERRSFIDSFICQLSSSYLRDLIDFRRVVKQRNSLFTSDKLSQISLKNLLEPWNEQLVSAGSRIILKRSETLSAFGQYLEKGYELIAGIGHKPHMEYKTFTEKLSDLAQIESDYRDSLSLVFEKEWERQQSLIGPHRDDVIFYLDDMELRKFGSQGQHRLFALALKIAQREYFHDELDDLPVFLLDDVFGDLDPSKTKILVQMLEQQDGQTFITAANKALFKGIINFAQEDVHFYDVQDAHVALSLK